MSDSIGRITVPSSVDSGLTFPLTAPDYGYGMSRDWRVIEHRYGDLATLGVQRFSLGSGARRFSFAKAALSQSDRASLLSFYDATQGSYQSFTYPVPGTDRNSFTNYTVVFDLPPLSITDLANRCQTGITFHEIISPSSAPSYTVGTVYTRFPSGGLATALTQEVQTIIPLIHIRVRNPAVPDIFLSDRRVNISGFPDPGASSPQTFLPRLLSMGEPGSDVILSQSLDGRADNIRFTFGNADRVMTKLAGDCSLQYASISLSLFHVQTNALLQLWKGIILSWQSDGSSQFPVFCSDGLYPITQSYPRRVISRQCWKTFNDGLHCPWASKGTGGDGSSCDYFFNSPNGCLSHGMSNYFGGHPTFPQSVTIKDNGTGTIAGFGRSIVTSTSIVSDSIWGKPLPEIWCNDGGTPQRALYTNALVAAVRDESDFEDVLGIVGAGPISAYEGMSVQTNSDGYKFIVAPLADGFPPQGFKVDGQLNVTGYQPTLGLREVVGNDPCKLSTSIFDGTDVFSLGQGTPQHWDEPDPNFSNLPGLSHVIFPYAAGTAFVELRYAKSAGSGILPTTAESHSMSVPISQGLTGVTFDAGGGASQVPGLTNPFWVAVNSYLRALGLDASASTDQLAAFVLSSLTNGSGTGAADIADFWVDPLVGTAPSQYSITQLGAQLQSPNLDVNNNTFTYQDADTGDLITLSISAAIGAGYVVVISTGQERQFQFQGVVGTELKPFRDWLTEILNCCLGYFTFEFGALRLGCRYNAVPTVAFTIGNMLYQSLGLSPMESAFEYLKIDFANVDLQFQSDFAEYQDKDHAAYFGRAGTPLSARMRSVGLSTLSQALRICATRTREECGGILRTDQSNPYIEFDNFNRATWRSTIMALDASVGQVASITHPDITTYPGAPGGSSSPANTWNYRIDRLQVHQDWSVTLSGRSVTDSMYSLEFGPKPTAVAPPSLPILFFPEPLGEWAPYQIQADAADALYPSEYTFDLAQTYVTLTDQSIQASATITGRLPVNSFIPNCGAVDLKKGNVSWSSSGGTLAGNATYYIQVCATDASGSYSPPSEVIVIQIPSGTNTNKITLSGIVWPNVAGLTGYVIFASADEQLISGQATGALSGSAGAYSPTQLTLSSCSLRSTYAVPDYDLAKLRMKGTRLIHGGVLGAGVTSLDSTSITASDTVDVSGVDNWTGRVLAIIGRATVPGSAPFAAFNITAFDHSIGKLTLDRDPTAAGVLTSDILTVCFLGYDNSATPTVLTDAGLSNATNGHTGETPNDPNRIGNIVLCIKGTGRGQTAKIISNTSTSYTLDRNFVIDSTSVWVVLHANWEALSDADIDNADPTKSTKLTLEVTNYDDLPMLITVAQVDDQGNESDPTDALYRMIWIKGDAGAGPTPPPTPGAISFTPLLATYGSISVENVAVASPVSQTAVDWYVLYVDELTADAFVTINSGVSTSDPVTVATTDNPNWTTPFTTLDFAVNDYVLWNDNGHYEIGQLTAITGSHPNLTFTIKRSFGGSPWFGGSAAYAHASNTGIFKAQLRRLIPNSQTNGYNNAAPPTRFDFPLPAACVLALMAAPFATFGATPQYGSFVIVNTATASLPGIRTCSGGSVTREVPGTLAVSSVNLAADFYIPFDVPYRVGWCYVAGAPTGGSLKVNIRYSTDGGATWNTLEQLVISASNSTNWSSNPPEKQQQPYDTTNLTWPFPKLAGGTRINVTIPQVGSTLPGTSLVVALGV